jgi:hypothetical protein
MKKIIAFLLILITVVLFPTQSSARADGLVEVVDQSVEFNFGEEISFQIEYKSDQPIESITLSIHAPGLPTFVGAVSITGAGKGDFVYAVSDRPLPAFSSISYNYQFILKSGEIVESPDYEFTYLDNRYNWQELIEEPFKIYWYEGEINLAQEVLDAALHGQTKTLEILKQPPDLQPIVIFIYSSAEELQSSLTAVGQTWVSGYADPARGSVVVALPPAVDQPLEIQRLIPHEIAHILLYRFLGPEFSYLPAWLNEGFASQMEIYSLPEYKLILERAYEGRDLIPFLHLCQAFPADPELARQAYAQADALVEYIQQEYGLPGLQSLIYAYDQGVSCERGVEMAFGIDLQTLDNNWQRDTFAQDTIRLYIYLLAGLLLVLILALSGFIIYKKRQPSSQGDWDENETL